MIACYTDHSISGASLTRSGVEGLMEDVQAGWFDVVLGEWLDRISRDQEDIAGVFKRLTFGSVQLVTLSEGPISELHVGLKGTMGALYLKKLAQKTHRGQRGRVKQGRCGGGLSYGYRVVRDGDEAGQREIVAAEAAVVRRIF